MNSLPAELRTPPLPVVAYVGCPELHKEVGAYFNTTLRPPVFSVGLAEANEGLLSRLFGAKHEPKPFSTPDGILKADWFLKQRQRRPAVAVAFVPRSDIDGDPSSWMRMLAGLRAIKAASAHKPVWLLLVAVQDGPVTELPQDRVTGLWSNVEPQQLVVISRLVFDPAVPIEQRRQMQEEQLRPLGQLVLEAAAAYYTAAAARLRQKQVDLTASLGSCPPEINAAIAFKLAVLAEFRQDWLAAVSSYQAAAAALQAVPLGRPTVSCQRHAEVTAVAEVVHFKAMMLLLHQQRYAEAIQQLNSHLAAFGHVPDGLPLSAAAAHHGWLARQYQTAAEMIAGSRMDAATLQVHREVSPFHLLMSAAQLAITRKSMVEQLSQLRGGGPTPFEPAAVKRGRYLGQVELRQPEGQGGSSDLTDAESCLYLEAEERRVNHCQVVMDLLTQAQAMHMKQASLAAAVPAASAPMAVVKGGSRGAADRVAARLAYLIAEQQVETHNLTAARKLLLQVAYTYRRDGWDSLLLHSLLLLRDVCQRLKLQKESLLHSLEIACLAEFLGLQEKSSGTGSSTGMFDHEQAQALASAALLTLLAGPTDNKSNLRKPLAQQHQQPPVLEHAADLQQQQQQQQQEALQQQHGDSPSAADDTAAASLSTAGAVSSSGTSSGSKGSSTSSRWEYVVQQVDLAAALQQVPAPKEDGSPRPNSAGDVLLLHKQQDYGWWRILTVSGGFVVHSPDPAQLCLCLALHNNLPVTLPLEAASIALADSKGSWRQTLDIGPAPSQCRSGRSGSGAKGREPSTSASSAAGALADGLSSLQLTEERHPQAQQQQPAASSTWPLQLQPGTWQLLHAVFEPRCIGSLMCEQLDLQLSPQVSISFGVSSFPPGRPALGVSTLPVGRKAPFSLQQQVKVGSWSAKVQHVGALPEVQVLLPELLLVGEFVPIEVQVQVTAEQAVASLELSVRSAATNAVPEQLTLLSALSDGKLHEVNLESQSFPVPHLAPGSIWMQRLWARSRHPTECRLTAVLSCPALVVQNADLNFKLPFEHRVRLSAESGVHTLVAPSTAYSAINGDGISSSSADVAAAGVVGGGTASSSSSAIPLVVGQSLLAQVLVASSHSAELLLLNADVELQQGSGLKLLNKLSDQLASKPITASPGSVHCLLLHLMPTATAQGPVSIGRLKLSWRRRHAAAAVAAASSSSSSRRGSAATGPKTADGAAAGLAVGAAPSEEVETYLNLPHVLVQESLLSIKVVAPQNATAGVQFPFTLQVHNPTSQPQEVQLSVQDAQGFVFSGSKQQMLHLVPRSMQTNTWTLVAHMSGQLQLPTIRVSSVRLSCFVVTQGAYIHVMPF